MTEVAQTVPAQAVEQPEVQHAPETSQEVVVNGDLPNGHDEGVEAVEKGMNGLKVSQGDLFTACSEGNLDLIRRILASGVESLEHLDPSTGCTPIVLAIRNNQPDVVRELLQAGSIVPPPGVTSDPTIISILYPQNIYSMAPYGMQPEFYPQPTFYPTDNRYYERPQRQRKESESGQANLPPMDVAKTIPCRNFPNCKYGSGCAFFHPLQAGPGPFYGQPFGYDNGYQNFQQQPPQMSFPQPGPGGYQNFQPMRNQQPPQDNFTQQHQLDPSQQSQHVQQHEISPSNDTQSDPTQNIPSVPSSAQPIPQPQMQNFTPFQPQQIPMSPPSQFGASPLSPSALVGSLPSIPPADQFFAATSPTNGFVMPPNGFMQPGHARRQSFGQFNNGGPIPNGKPFGHSKKASFSGGPRPFGTGPRVDFGKWKDGMPPPCAFFLQGKCRNGEFCKFPHINETGIDCRHPDVINGALPPMPSMGRQPRPPRQYPLDPKNHQLAFLQHQRAAVQNGFQTGPIPGMIEDLEASQTLSEPVKPSVTAQSTPNPNDGSLPPKPVTPNAITAMSRSASQPGVQRVHANGITSRSQSPAPSNVSFHGAGHPRRNNSRPPFQNGRSQSNEKKFNNHQQQQPQQQTRKQRIPSSDEFPALNGFEKKVTSPVGNGRTAAQILSAPAPLPIPKVTRQESNSSKSDESITMDSDNDSDGVIISCKPSTSTTPSAPVSGSASPVKRGSLSFASIAGNLAPPEALAIRAQ